MKGLSAETCDGFLNALWGIEIMLMGQILELTKCLQVTDFLVSLMGCHYNGWHYNGKHSLMEGHYQNRPI